jgi:3-methyladenine DNA glycosylase Tag
MMGRARAAAEGERFMTQRRPGRIYHDDSPWPHLELGPADDRRYLEQLIKAIFAAGLNWQVVQSHWAALGEVFHGFDPAAMAAMTERDIDRAAQNPHVIRNRRKISESVESAAAANEVIAEHRSFDAFLRSFGSPEEEIADLRDRFPGLGDFSAWWFMQSVGLPVPPAD